jgi:predicted metal-dependent phosphoesterase TrpH
MIDLHTHTTFSDGTTSPTENAALASDEGLVGLAVTDHDTMAGLQEAAEACRERGLVFVPGLELSTELGGRGVHILGYDVDPDDPDLVAECDRLRNERLRRAQAMVRRLADLGVDVPVDDVRNHRPHVAAAMVAAGAVADIGEAFDRFIADGGPAYVSKHALEPERGVALIRGAGGVAVLAHPGLDHRHADVDLALLDRLVAAGLAGVEADHVGHDDQARRFWRQAATERDLVVTGSSDFHGTRKQSRIGEAATPVSVTERLRARASDKESLGW